MTGYEILYWSLIGIVWGWAAAVWIEALAPSVRRRVSEWRWRRWYRSLSPAERTQAQIDSGTRLAEAMRSWGLTAAEATEAFGKLIPR